MGKEQRKKLKEVLKELSELNFREHRNSLEDFRGLNEAIDGIFAEPETLPEQKHCWVLPTGVLSKHLAHRECCECMESKELSNLSLDKALEDGIKNAFEEGKKEGREEMKEYMREVFTLTEDGLKTSNLLASQIMYNKLKDLLK